MPETEFEPGDVVMLRSGGPAMTVVEVSDALVSCLWIAEPDEQIRSAQIPAVALAMIERDEDIEEDDEDEDDEDEEEDDEDEAD